MEKLNLNRRQFLSGLAGSVSIGSSAAWAQPESVDLLRENDAEAILWQETWAEFNAILKQRALFNDVEYSTMAVFNESRELAVFDLSEGTSSSADFENDAVIDNLQKINKPTTLIVAHTHSLSDEGSSRPNVTLAQIEEFRQTNRSVHTPPSVPDLDQSFLEEAIKNSGIVITILNQVHDGTGVWVYRKFTTQDQVYFPEIQEFYAKLSLEKEQVYGKSFMGGAVGKYLLNQNDESISAWYSLIDHQYPSIETIDDKRHALRAYLRNLEKPDMVGMKKNYNTVYEILESDTSFEGRDVLRKQIKGPAVDSLISLQSLQDLFVRKSIDGELQVEDFRSLSLEYARKGALLASVPGDLISTKAPDTDPTAWL